MPRSSDDQATIARLRQELVWAGQVEANLRERLTDVETELARVRQGDWVVWDLWLREVPPGWRCWRVRRRAEARQRAA